MQDAVVVAGNPVLTGFLVRSDNSAEPGYIPSLPLSRFNSMVKVGRLGGESGESLPTKLPLPPFAVIWSLPPRPQEAALMYIAPAAVLSDQYVRQWLFHLGLPFWEESNVLGFATSATAVDPSDYPSRTAREPVRLTGRQERLAFDALGAKDEIETRPFDTKPGNNLPPEVKIHPLPAAVARLLALRGHRYVRLQDRIVLVSPAPDRIIVGEFGRSRNGQY
jgi:Protein of unknown function (DUF1236)